MELKQKILETAIVVFNQKGMKFTMDDLARQLEISKKTIYTVFLNKEELLYGMVDYMFDSIKESERAIVEDGSLSLIEKIRSILVVLPAGYRELDFSQLYQMVSGYRKVFTAPTDWKGKHVVLTFEGVAHDSEVFLNEEKIAGHHCGYTAFSADISAKRGIWAKSVSGVL